MIIGTAGHVDHGKTSLVKALTGIDTDRLQEEKRRGITLELGFAHLKLDDGSVAGVVDVPGHERFIKAMVAGAGGVDLAILVVASDEGVRPQTREHLDICRMLGVRAGVIALTKSDLLPGLGAEWLELVKADLTELVKGSFLEGAAIVPCSSLTGEGLKPLVAELTRLAKAHPARPSEAVTFLPIDRAFTLKGFGTVATGALLSGQLAVDDLVSLLPGLPGPLRVRGLQVHGKPVGKALAGSRVAANLADVQTAAVARGMALTREGELPEARMLDVELALLPEAERPLPRLSKLLLHVGTAQVPATVALLDPEALAPGQSALAQLRLARPVAALPDQRFILRGARTLPGRGATLAGGRILSLTPARRRRGTGALLQPLVTADAHARLGWQLGQAGFLGAAERALVGLTGLSPKQVQRSLELLSTRGEALLVDRERRLFVAPAALKRLEDKAMAVLADFHRREPMSEGMSKEELRQRLSPALDAKVLARLFSALVAAGRVETAGEAVRLPGRGRTLEGGDLQARDAILASLTQAKLAPPRLDELAASAKTSAQHVGQLLQTLVAEGRVLKVSEELYFERSALEGLQARLVEHLKANKEITTQAFKELVGQSRKFVIPLSEYFDREKVTLRVGDKRVLRRG